MLNIAAYTVRQIMLLNIRHHTLYLTAVLYLWFESQDFVMQKTTTQRINKRDALNKN